MLSDLCGDFIGKCPPTTAATGENLQLVAVEKSRLQQREQPVLGATWIESVDKVKNSHVIVDYLVPSIMPDRV
ncbi:MAG: hypothetical protein E5W57_00805 [Mesorhizobium sp.]|nr:MAG: hypothetical protein E5W57_00805 [Mesorhizobium sp.]